MKKKMKFVHMERVWKIRSVFEALVEFENVLKEGSVRM